MVEFNADGSIKLPGRIQAREDANKQKLESQRCIKVQKEVISFQAPKKCVLHLTLSKALKDPRFIEYIFNEFKQSTETPTKLTKDENNQIKIEIGTNFRRCSDCTNLIGRYREFLDGNLILKKGNCTFEGRQKSFAYEDYFD